MLVDFLFLFVRLHCIGTVRMCHNWAFSRGQWDERSYLGQVPIPRDVARAIRLLLCLCRYKLRRPLSSPRLRCLTTILKTQLSKLRRPLSSPHLRCWTTILNSQLFAAKCLTFESRLFHNARLVNKIQCSKSENIEDILVF